MAVRLEQLSVGDVTLLANRSDVRVLPPRELALPCVTLQPVYLGCRLVLVGCFWRGLGEAGSLFFLRRKTSARPEEAWKEFENLAAAKTA